MLVSKTGQGHGSTFYFTLPYVPIDEKTRRGRMRDRAGRQ